MAIKLFVDGNSTATVSDSDTTVVAFGTGTQGIKIASGVTGVIVGSDLERIDVAGNLADYKYVYVAGTGTQIQNAAGTVVGTIPTINASAGLTVAFADGSAPLVQTATGFTLGGTALPTTAAPITTAALGTNFNTAVKSAVVPATTVITTPTLSIAAASLTEGNTGTANMPFTVSLSAASTSAVTVGYATTGVTATSGSDFTNTTGTLTIAAGQTSGIINVPVLGDTTNETNETFTVTLSSPTNATVATASATGTITNDDVNAAPTIGYTAGSLGATVPVAKDVQSAAGLLGAFVVADTDTALLTATISASSGLLNISAGAVSYGSGTSTTSTTPSVTIQGSAAQLNLALNSIKYTAAGAAATTDNVVISINDGTTTATKTVPVLVQTTFTLTNGTSNNLVGTSGADLFSASATGPVTIENGDTIAAGDGIDVLTFAGASGAVAANTLASQVTGLEIVNITSATGGTITSTLDSSLIGGLTTVNLTATTPASDVFTVSNLSNTQTVNFLTSATGDTIGNVSNGSVIGTQTVNLGLTGGIALAGNTTINGDLINISSTGTSVNSIASLVLSGGAAAAVVVTGSAALTITAVTTQTVNSFDASAATGAITFTELAVGTGLSFIGGSAGDTVVGDSSADILDGRAGNDSLTNRAAGVASAADTMAGGLGSDTFILYGDSASAANYTGSSWISDFSIGTAATSVATTGTVGGSDTLTLSATKGNYSAGGTAFAAGVATAAIGTTALQSVAQNATATAYIAGTDMIKLTTPVAFTTSLQGTFNAAIGSATVTATGANADEIYFSLYDTTNSRMVVGIVYEGAADQAVGTGDVVTLVGTLSMTAADYAAFSNTNLAIIA